MNVAEAVGATLARLGVGHAFGVVGSGNFALVKALRAHGVPYTAARHEGGAATMADAYSRTAGRLAVVTTHQGCGFTNALTGVAEAAKSRTPLIVLTADAPPSARFNNFRIDQDAAAQALGAVAERVYSPATAAADAERAWTVAMHDRRTVVLSVPIDLLTQPAPEVAVNAPGSGDHTVDPRAVRPTAEDAQALADLLAGAQRPVFIAGRGAREAGAEIAALAERCGALLATSAVVKGLFRGSADGVVPSHGGADLGISGGFATPLAAELIADADVVVGFGCALNNWTTRHGRLIGTDARIAQVDLDPLALGAHRPIALGIVGDCALVAHDTAMLLTPRVVADFRDQTQENRPLADFPGEREPERGGAAELFTRRVVADFRHQTKENRPLADFPGEREPERGGAAELFTRRVVADFRHQTQENRPLADFPGEREPERGGAAEVFTRRVVADFRHQTQENRPLADFRREKEREWRQEEGEGAGGGEGGGTGQGYRTPEVLARIAAEGRWRDVAFEALDEPCRIDPRTVTIALDHALPTERVVAVDSGNFMGYPSQFLDVPDVAGFCFTQAFQSIGLGLATAIGAAVARPDRIPVLGTGDGGFHMAIADLETAVRLRLPLVVLVYNDASYSAEVHHFGESDETVAFPDTDLAAIARGFGADGVTVRSTDDLHAMAAAVAECVARPRSEARPLVIDAKIASDGGSWWLAEAFRAH